MAKADDSDPCCPTTATAGVGRCAFISLVGCAAVAWPFEVRAQQTPLPVIGFLGSSSPDQYAIRVRAFRQGLKETGYVEGQNVAIEYRWAKDDNKRLAVLAAELVQRRVAVIAAGGGTASALAAKAATATVPVVFAVAVDPIKVGLVASLSRPGGNVTGVTNLNVEVGPKRLELVRELLPKATTVAVLVNPTNPALTEQVSRSLQPTARNLGMQLQVLPASTERDLDTVFATLAQLRADALVIASDIFLYGRLEQLAARALHSALPAFSQYQQFVAAGGLVSYGATET